MTARQREKRGRSLRSLAFETSGSVADVFNASSLPCGVWPRQTQLSKEEEEGWQGRIRRRALAANLFSSGGAYTEIALSMLDALRPRCSLMSEAHIWMKDIPNFVEEEKVRIPIALWMQHDTATIMTSA